MRAALLAVVLLLAAPLARADARITVLVDLLRLPDLVTIFREEGRAYADTLDRDMLDGRGGAFWQAQVAQIYTADPILEALRRALAQGLDEAQLQAAIAHFSSAAGQRVIGLEIAARRAIADPVIEEAARSHFAQAADAGDPLAALVPRFVEASDLVERNVTLSLNAEIRFSMGLADGRYADLSEAQIIDEAWARQDRIRAETEAWLNGFLLMAYHPLHGETPAALEAHLDFCRSPAGQALYAALFDGFDTVYREVSYALGRAVALNAEGDEI